MGILYFQRKVDVFLETHDVLDDDDDADTVPLEEVAGVASPDDDS